MFYDEDMLLDLRFNVLNEYVDKFIISEAVYTHNGEQKKLNFDINKFSKFKDKIEYLIVKEPPPTILKINSEDSEQTRGEKLILNGYKRDHYQRQKLQEGLNDADSEDLIIISDLDEIPKLETINIKNINNKLIFFKQKMFYYKFNLFYDAIPWYGSKACKKKYFKSPEWLRSIKNKKYPLWRFDILFSQKKYHDILYVDSGGWHFTNVREPEDLEKKLLNFLHHVDFKQSGLKIEDLRRLIHEKKIMYNHAVDKKNEKWGEGSTLKKVGLEDMPKYIFENINKYQHWLDL